MVRTSGRWALGVLCSVAMGASGCVVSDSGGSGGGGGNANGTITVQNNSSHVLIGVYVAPVNQVNWGPDQLYNDLFPGERITIEVRCSTYDVLVRDDRQRDCVLGNLDLCFSDNVWVIDNGLLRNCGY